MTTPSKNDTFDTRSDVDEAASFNVVAEDSESSCARYRSKSMDLIAANSNSAHETISQQDPLISAPKSAPPYIDAVRSLETLDGSPLRPSERMPDAPQTCPTRGCRVREARRTHGRKRRSHTQTRPERNSDKVPLGAGLETDRERPRRRRNSRSGEEDSENSSASSRAVASPPATFRVGSPSLSGLSFILKPINGLNIVRSGRPSSSLGGAESVPVPVPMTAGSNLIPSFLEPVTPARQHDLSPLKNPLSPSHHWSNFADAEEGDMQLMTARDFPGSRLSSARVVGPRRSRSMVVMERAASSPPWEWPKRALTAVVSGTSSLSLRRAPLSANEFCEALSSECSSSSELHLSVVRSHSFPPCQRPLYVGGSFSAR